VEHLSGAPEEIVSHSMAGRRVPVFFYGLFMDADALRKKGVQPMNPRRCRVSGFRLRIGKRAALVPEPEASVFGILMELTHGEIERLYAEPGVREYRPEAVIAELEDGARIPALVFNLPEPAGPEAANREYAQQLRDLARRLGLPPDYLEQIG
jgi:hypothetical protein